jgi:hypothetical protein
MEMTYMNYKIDNAHREIYFLRGMVNYLKSHPEEKIWVDNFLEKKQGYRLNYYSQNTFDSVPHLRKMHTMTIRKPETSFHADGNSDLAKIRRELKLGCGYAYVMVFDGGFKVGLTNDLKRRRNQLNASHDHHYEIVWSSSFSTYEAAAMMECDLHYYYKKLFPNNFIPNDHFNIDGFDAKRDVRKLNKMAKECEARYAA